MDQRFDGVSVLNHLDKHAIDRRIAIARDYQIVLPWLRPCRVRVLLVTDGGLDFGRGDFGLSAFLDTLLNQNRFYVRFDISLAHLRGNVTAEQMASSVNGITRRVTDFRFDDPGMFSNDLYDQVWLFGIETSYTNMNNYPYRVQNRYPTQRLANAEIDAISTFMDNRGGVFATGDHGALGRGLCGQIKRVKSMRLWDSTSADNAIDEVSMNGERRNDTNQVGRDSNTQFSDQSDDIPQTIQPNFYYTRRGIFRDKYPHPLLCSALGLIDVLPDHPHEGQCALPTTAAQLAEYPGGILPEIIATGNVPSGNTASLRGSKRPTVAHSFGVIGAYDGHLANVGRIVTDSTWHHFVNVNLIGLADGGTFDDLDPSASEQMKLQGFLSTPSGRAALARIREYFINIGVWISPPSLLQCFNSKFIYRLLYTDRIMEAALPDPNIRFERISLDVLFGIGAHAKDVLGRVASKCASTQLMIDLVQAHFPDFRPWVDPWVPRASFKKSEPGLPVVDLDTATNIMMGTLLVKLRQEHPYPSENVARTFFATGFETLTRPAALGLSLAVEHMTKELAVHNELFVSSLKSFGQKAKAKPTSRK